MSITLLFLMATMLLANVGFGVILPTLPFLSKSIGATTFELGLALTIFALAQLVFSPVWGLLTDKMGRRPILVVGIIGYGLTSALVAFVPNVTLLLSLRFLAGGFVAAVFPPIQALVSDLTPKRDRTRILGYMASMNGIGFIIGPLVGSLLSIFGYRTPFLGVAFLSLLNGLFAMILLPKGQKIENKISEKSGRFGIESFYEGLHSFLNIKIAPFLIGALVFATTDSSITSTLAYFITDHLNSSQVVVGWAFMVNGGMGAMVQMLLLSKVHQRYGETVTIIIGFTLGIIGYFALAMSPFILWALVAIAVVACCRGFVMPVMTAAISVRTPEEAQGRGFGSQQTARSIGRMIGPMIAGALFNYKEAAPFLFASVFIMIFVIFYLSWIHWMTKHPSKRHSVDI